MTPQQALQNLTQASGLAPLTRDTHQAIIESINVLDSYIKQQEKDKEKVDTQPKHIESVV